MLPNIKISVSGLDGLRAEFEALGGETQTNIMQTAFERGAKVIQNDAQAFCPVATGRLRGAIEIQTNKRQGNVITKVQVKQGGTAYKGQYFIAAFQEFGWHVGSRMGANVATRKFKQGVHFMRQAVIKNKSSVPEQICREIAEQITNMANR